mgnify:CR=1 FL=1
MPNKTTNVLANELNYDKYATEIYDDDIKRSIPGYDDLHKAIEKVVHNYTGEYQVKKNSRTGGWNWPYFRKNTKNYSSLLRFLCFDL